MGSDPRIYPHPAIAERADRERIKAELLATLSIQEMLELSPDLKTNYQHQVESERDAAVAAALELAAVAGRGVVLNFNRSPKNSVPFIEECDAVADAIRALITPAQASALETLLAEARTDGAQKEAAVWHRMILDGNGLDPIRKDWDEFNSQAGEFSADDAHSFVNWLRNKARTARDEATVEAFKEAIATVVSTMSGSSPIALRKHPTYLAAKSREDARRAAEQERRHRAS